MSLYQVIEVLPLSASALGSRQIVAIVRTFQGSALPRDALWRPVSGHCGFSLESESRTEHHVDLGGTVLEDLRSRRNSRMGRSLLPSGALLPCSRSQQFACRDCLPRRTV
jgi:hypothetical protein